MNLNRPITTNNKEGRVLVIINEKYKVFREE